MSIEGNPGQPPRPDSSEFSQTTEVVRAHPNDWRRIAIGAIGLYGASKLQLHPPFSGIKELAEDAVYIIDSLACLQGVRPFFRKLF